MKPRQIRLDLDFDSGIYDPVLVCSDGRLEPLNKTTWEWHGPWPEKAGFFLFTLREDNDEDRVTGCVCFARALVIPGHGGSVLINSKGRKIGELIELGCPSPIETKLLTLPFSEESFDSHPIGYSSLNLFTREPIRTGALRTCISQFGLKIPTWVFYCGLDYAEETKVQTQVWQNLIAHARSWADSEPEVLGQVLGFLPWSASYLFDKSRSGSKDWDMADDFSHLLCEPDTKYKSGDCEDFSSTMMRLFYSLSQTTLLPLIHQYCPLVMDTIITVNGKDCLHNMVVLAPWQLLVDHWLPPHQADLAASHFPDRRADLPVLILESTDWSLVDWSRDRLAKSRLTQHSHPRVRYPFPPSGFQQQGYFKAFVVAYSYLLRQATDGYTSFVILNPEEHDELGCTPFQLTDPVEQKRLRFVPREVGRTSQEEFLAKQCLSLAIPPSLPLVASSVYKTTPRPGAFPLYVRQAYCHSLETAEDWVKRTWRHLEVVGAEQFRLCDQFDGLYCIWCLIKE
jgi:hypothetical protein